MSVAVVTGAARGLGAEFCRQLLRRGYDVVGVDVVGVGTPIDGDPALPLVRELDVTDAGAIRQLAAEANPSVWISNAGVLCPGDSATQPDAEIERVIGVNTLGVIHATRAAVAQMRANDGGHVINVASLAAWVPVPGVNVYAASKAAAMSFTLGLRAELAAAGVDNIHLGVVCPDGIMTPMIAEELDNPAISLTFSGVRLTTVAEVATAGLSLLDRPRAVVSVPHWRGAQVRLLGAFADRALRLAPVFEKVARRKQTKIRKSSPAN